MHWDEYQRYLNILITPVLTTGFIVALFWIWKKIVFAEYKKDLDRAQKIFFRFSDTQFNHYLIIWKSIVAIDRAADILWEDNSPNNFKLFLVTITDHEKTIDENSLLIEDNSYNKINELLNKFNKYRDNKGHLVRYNKAIDNINNDFNFNNNMINNYISDNQIIRKDYKTLIGQIKKEFKDKLKGL